MRQLRHQLMSFLFFLLITCLTHISRAAGPPYSAALLHPRLGDTVLAGHPYTVTWTIDPSFSTLNLIILGSGFNTEIATQIPNTGSFNWSVETWWPSTNIAMVLNRVDWNTNNDFSTFRMVSVGDQTGFAGGSQGTTVTMTMTVTSTMNCPNIPTSGIMATSSLEASSSGISPGTVGGIVGGLCAGFLILVSTMFCLYYRQKAKQAESLSIRLPEATLQRERENLTELPTDMLAERGNIPTYQHLRYPERESVGGRVNSMS